MSKKRKFKVGDRVVIKREWSPDCPWACGAGTREGKSGVLTSFCRIPGYPYRVKVDGSPHPILVHSVRHERAPKGLAKEHERRAGQISSLINAGFIPESVVEAISADDFSLLRHSGLVAVKLTSAHQHWAGCWAGSWFPDGTINGEQR